MARRAAPPATECEQLDRMLGEAIRSTVASLAPFSDESMRRVITLLHTDERARTANDFDTLMLEFLAQFGERMVHAPALSVEPFQPGSEAERSLICYRMRIEQFVEGLLSWYHLQRTAAGCHELEGTGAPGPVEAPLTTERTLEVRRDATPAVDPRVWDRISATAMVIYEDLEYLRTLENRRRTLSTGLRRWQILSDIAAQRANLRSARDLYALSRLLEASGTRFRELERTLMTTDPGKAVLRAALEIGEEAERAALARGAAFFFLRAELRDRPEFAAQREAAVTRAIDAARSYHERRAQLEAGIQPDSERESISASVEVMGEDRVAEIEAARDAGHDEPLIAGTVFGAPIEFDGAPIQLYDNIARESLPQIGSDIELETPDLYLSEIELRANALGEQQANLGKLSAAEQEYADTLLQSQTISAALTVSFQFLVDQVFALIEGAVQPVLQVPARLFPETPFGASANAEAIAACAENARAEALEQEELTGEFRVVETALRGALLGAFNVDSEGGLVAGAGAVEALLAPDALEFVELDVRPSGVVAAVAQSGAAAVRLEGQAGFALSQPSLAEARSATPFVFQARPDDVLTFGPEIIWPDGDRLTMPALEDGTAPWGLLPLLGTERGAVVALYPLLAAGSLGLVVRSVAAAEEGVDGVEVPLPAGAVGPDPARWVSRVRLFPQQQRVYLSVDRLLLVIDYTDALAVEAHALREPVDWDARERAFVFVDPDGSLVFLTGAGEPIVVALEPGERAAGVGVVDCVVASYWLRSPAGAWSHVAQYFRDDGTFTRGAPRAAPPLGDVAAVVALRPAHRYLVERADGSHALLVLGPRAGPARRATKRERGDGAAGAEAPVKRERRGGEEVD